MGHGCIDPKGAEVTSEVNTLGTLGALTGVFNSKRFDITQGKGPNTKFYFIQPILLIDGPEKGCLDDVNKQAS